MRSDVGEGETKSETVSRNAIFIHLGSYVETSRVWPRRDPAGQLWEGNGIIFCLFVFVLFLFCFVFDFLNFIFLYSRFLLVIHFIHISVYMSIPIAQFITPPPPPRHFPRLGVHTFVLYICVSISALQTSSSVPFF